MVGKKVAFSLCGCDPGVFEDPRCKAAKENDALFLLHSTSSAVTFMRRGRIGPFVSMSIRAGK